MYSLTLYLQLITLQMPIKRWPALKGLAIQCFKMMETATRRRFHQWLPDTRNL